MTAGALSFAPVTKADAPALADIRVAAMRASLQSVGRFDPQRARDRFLAGFEPANTQAITLQGERVGFVVVRQREGQLLLDHLYLLPSAQSQGLGAQVMRWLFGMADAQNLPVRVGALKGSRANAFYGRHGFQLVEAAEWDNYYLRMPGTS